MEQRRLARAEDVLRSVAAAASLLSDAGDRPDAVSLAAQASAELAGVTGVDPALDAIMTGVTEVLYQITELSRELHGFLDTIAIDPARLQVVDERLRQYSELTRKYGGDTAAT